MNPDRRGQLGDRLERGAAFGRYMVLERLGGGGMGVVYSAYDPELNRKLAVKVLKPEASDKSTASAGRSRLLREAQAMAKLAHPNVIAVYDVGTLGDNVFIAMEYVDGVTLTSWLSPVRPWREVLSIFLQAGKGLAAAHGAGLVHRDFKPGNVLVGNDGRVRVLDFGLAHGTEEADADSAASELAETVLSPRADALAARLTKTGAFMGTPAYMAPEQLRGFPTDARADQFSFCVALYEGIYRESPYAGDDVMTHALEVMSGRVKEQPKSSRVPTWLKQVVLRGLRPELKDRYPSMAALLAELERDPTFKRRRMIAVAGTLAVACGAAWGLHHARSLQGQVCRGAERKLVGVWDAGRKQTIARAFLASGRPYAADAVREVERGLDAYTQAWVGMSTAACEATRLRGEQSEELLDLRVGCLSQRLEELKALTDLFARADGALVERAVQASQNLAPVTSCAQVAALRAPLPPPRDTVTQAKVRAIQAALAGAKALEDAGRYGDGLKQASVAARDAKTLGHRPLEAEALYRYGSLQQRNGDPVGAAETAEAALLAAEAGRHDSMAAEAWMLLMRTAIDRSRYNEARQAARHAFALIDRLGGNDRFRAQVNDYLGTVEGRQGNYPESLELHRRALALNERLLGPAHRAVAISLNNIGNTLKLQKQYDQALAYYRRASVIWERTLGVDHPAVATSLGNIAGVLLAQRQYAEAITYYTRDLEILERSVGSNHPDLAFPVHGLGVSWLYLGQPERAIEPLERALEIREHHPEGRAFLAVIRHDLAEALRVAGRDPRRVRQLETQVREAMRSTPVGHDPPVGQQAPGAGSGSPRGVPGGDRL